VSAKKKNLVKTDNAHIMKMILHYMHLWVYVPGAVIVSSSLIACVLMWERGQGGGGPKEKGAGGVREAGDDGAGSGNPKMAGSGRKREKLRNIAQYYAIEKMQRGGGQQIQDGKREV